MSALNVALSELNCLVFVAVRLCIDYAGFFELVNQEKQVFSGRHF